MKKLLYYNAPFPVAKVHADLEPYFLTRWRSAWKVWGEYAGEIGINGINKATGMERYLKAAGIAREIPLPWETVRMIFR